MRSELRARRGALPIGEKENIRLRVCDLTRENFPELSDACIGFYWPFQAEIDLGLSFVILSALARGLHCRSWPKSSNHWSFGHGNRK